ncbi:hypothetical protein Scep_023981 [Stephania cephalantha]|uniref:Aminotransferase-like plant mobile domain-containing protein n=1 Tax=Stephania cephalantha TaxID=152367 RepID=A0AAP0EVP6_9MAGN
MDGKAVLVDPEGFIEPIQLLQKALGVIEVVATKKLYIVRGNVSRLNWLQETFGTTKDASSYPTMIQTTKAYMLYLIGSTLFTNKSDGQVNVVILHLLMNVNQIASYAWGWRH